MIDKFGKVPTFRGYEFVGEYPYYGQTLKLATLQGPKRAMASDCFDLTYVPEPTVLEETFYLSTFQVDDTTYYAYCFDTLKTFAAAAVVASLFKWIAEE